MLAPHEGIQRLTYADTTYPNRIGWKDVVLTPQVEPTHELTAYPGDLAGSPRQRTELFAVRRADTLIATETPGTFDEAPAAASGVARSNQLSDMLARGTDNLGFVLATLLVAIGLGALHALEPGHGKTLIAVSLVGARATVRQAAILAGSVTLAHTIGVVALGFAIILCKGWFVPETIYPWITLTSGAAIVIIGARGLGAFCGAA